MTSSPDERSPEEKARAKRVHARVMLAIGYFTVACGAAAAFLAFSRVGAERVPFFWRQPRGGASAGLHLPGGDSVPSASIAWRAWESATLDEARRANRLILLSMCPSWSHECRLMDEFTFADPEIVSWARGNVVPIRVDPSARPDLSRVYSAPVWPLTALLLPTGEMLSSGGLIPSRQFLPWARQVGESARKNSESIWATSAAARQETEARRSRLLGGDAAGLSPRFGAREAVAAVQDRFENRFDPKNGGFGKGWKFPLPAANQFLAECYRWTREPHVRQLLDETLNGEARLEDPVWCGLYRGSSASDWRAPEYEKLLSVQAAAIEDLSAAYDLRADPERRRLIERTAAYVERFLKASEGTYYAGQDADVRLPGGGWVEGEQYYRMSEAERLKLGRPAVDRTLYAGANADLARAYLKAGAVLAKPEWIRRALGILDILWRRAVRPDGAVRHSFASGDQRDGARPELTGFLEDQTAVSRAELHAYLATGESRHLDRARKILSFVRGDLADPKTGALLAYPRSWSPGPGWFEPVDPDGTAAAALVYAELARVGAPSERIESERLTRWVSAHRKAVNSVAYARLALVLLNNRSNRGQ